jgi:RimJ/RimL family protein N-acetyltransferase
VPGSASVRLRAFVAADERPLAGLFAEPDVAVWNPAPPRLHVPRWIASSNAGSRGTEFRTWAVADAVDDRFLGTVSVFGMAPGESEAEIGYRVAAAEAGRGVATAAVRAAVRRAAEELGPASIRLYHAVENPASCRVALKTGFALDGEVCGLLPYGDGRLHEEHLHRLVP